jgi:hypothetical protein
MAASFSRHVSAIFGIKVTNPESLNCDIGQSLRVVQQPRPDSRTALGSFPEQYPSLSSFSDKLYGDFLLFNLKHHLDTTL